MRSEYIRLYDAFFRLQPSDCGQVIGDLVSESKFGIFKYGVHPAQTLMQLCNSRHAKLWFRYLRFKTRCNLIICGLTDKGLHILFLLSSHNGLLQFLHLVVHEFILPFAAAFQHCCLQPVGHSDCSRPTPICNPNSHTFLCVSGAFFMRTHIPPKNLPLYLATPSLQPIPMHQPQ